MLKSTGLKRLLLSAVLMAMLTATATPIRSLRAETAPVFRLMAMIPDSPDNRAEVSYLDMDVLASGRPGARIPASAEEWAAAQATKSAGAALYNAALFGANSGDPDLTMLWSRALEVKKTVGIDVFTIAQHVRFGKPPVSGVIYSGRFDTTAIDSALRVQSFVPQPPLDSFLLWCAADGCDKGTVLNMKAVTPTNPFGGNLGRRQPIAASSSVVFSSPNETLVREIARASAAKSPSLVDAYDYRALLNTVTATGELAQLYLLSPALLTAPPASVQPTAQATAEPIPAYSLIGFAHVIDGDQTHALITLVYNTKADAERAGIIIAARAARVKLRRAERTLIDFVKDRGGTFAAPRVVSDSATGKAVLVLDLQSPREPSIPDKNGRYTASGLLYALLVRLVQARDIAWLTPSGS